VWWSDHGGGCGERVMLHWYTMSKQSGPAAAVTAAAAFQHLNQRRVPVRLFLEVSTP